MMLGIIILSWLMMILLGLKKKDNANPFDMETSQVLRGICAIEILLGHVGLYTNSTILFANRRAGILIVGAFVIWITFQKELS